jgi:hypothetical protein
MPARGCPYQMEELGTLSLEKRSVGVATLMISAVALCTVFMDDGLFAPFVFFKVRERAVGQQFFLGSRKLVRSYTVCSMPAFLMMIVWGMQILWMIVQSLTAAPWVVKIAKNVLIT